jgi:hypothetical protein
MDKGRPSMGLGSKRKSESTKRKRPACSVTNIRPSGKKARDQGFSNPVNKLVSRKACVSVLMTKERSCAHEYEQPARVKSSK